MVGKNAPQEKDEAMSYAAALNIEKLAPAWRTLEAHAPVKLCAINSERHYRAMVALMNGLLDKIGERESHPLMGLLDIVTMFVDDYEERNVELPDSSPADVLRFLMQQHVLRQADLAELFGSQSNVSEVLTGKREINARQARELAKKFGVSVAVFI